MSCDCQNKINGMLTERFKKDEPAATDHKVKLQGYAIVLTDSGCVTKPFMEYETFANVPLKKGGTKPKKTTGNMVFSYCPFCGVKA